METATAEYYLGVLEAIDTCKAQVHLLRSAAPLTMQAMYKAMLDKFLSGRCHWLDPGKKEAFYFEINVKRGKEGQPVKLERGEIGYSYKIDSIIVCVASNATIPYDTVKIGEIKENIDGFKAVKNGTSIKLMLQR